MTAPQGWECPRCHAVYAPWVDPCSRAVAGGCLHDYDPVPGPAGFRCRRCGRLEPIEPHSTITWGPPLLGTALTALLAIGCASPVTVTTPACSIKAELRTGERITCSADGAEAKRESISETVRASGGMLGGALRMVLGGAAP